jgi:hypothetical protein
MSVKHATSPVPGLLAQLNSTVLSLMDRAGVGNVARQMRYFDAHVEQALALVLDFLVFSLLELESPAAWDTRLYSQPLHMVE